MIIAMSFSIVFSTRRLDSGFIDHINKTVGLKGVEIISYTNNGEFSLSELYNRGLRESKYDLVIFMHDDIVFNRANWGKALIKQFRYTDYGILGVAGTTDLVNDSRGIAEGWWAIQNRNVGRVKHKSAGKIVDSFFSNKYNYPIQVVCLDGVFLRFIKKGF